jgi:hypothetical protein
VNDLGSTKAKAKLRRALCKLECVPEHDGFLMIVELQNSGVEVMTGQPIGLW